jgi:anti-anti-sigma factor
MWPEIADRSEILLTGALGPITLEDMELTPFSCSTREENKCFIARPAGYLDEIAGTALREAFTEPARKGIKKFVLNLSDTPVINSQGITQILELVEVLMYDHKATLALVGLSDLYTDVFQVIGVLKMTRVFPDETTAIASL